LLLLNSASGSLLSVSSLAADHSAHHRHLAVAADDPMLLLRLRPVVRTLLGRGTKKADDDAGDLSDTAEATDDV